MTGPGEKTEMAKKSNYDKLFSALAELAKEMHSASVQIDALPEDHEYTDDQLETLGDLRLEGQKLHDATDEAVRAIQGR